MKHKPVLIRSLTIVLAMMILVGCAGSEAELSATIAPQVCPTAKPQSCPSSAPVTCPTAQACASTGAAQIPSAEKTWSSILYSASEIYITFDPGEKCMVNMAPSLLHSGKLYYNIKVNDQAHATYAVIFQTLDEGKTLADLQAYPKTASTEPSWDTVFGENYVGPGSNSYYAEEFSKGQVYISCFVSSGTGILRILDYGPVEIK